MGTVPQGSTTVGTLSESVRGQLLEYVEGQLSGLCRTVGTGLRPVPQGAHGDTVDEVLAAIFTKKEHRVMTWHNGEREEIM